VVVQVVVKTLLEQIVLAVAEQVVTETLLILKHLEVGHQANLP
tara:strand:+ start:53 stop:181 length:129 start_codon:yes stop_codon:yes gene_type:complete